MNPYSTIFMPPQYNDEFYFSNVLRSHVKFSFALLFFVILLIVLLWNVQPWFEIQIKPVQKLPNERVQSTNGQNFDPKLQSDVEFINYLVRPGDTLSGIAERFGVGLSVLLKYNGLDNPNVLRSGQRLKIPQRWNQ